MARLTWLGKSSLELVGVKEDVAKGRAVDPGKTEVALWGGQILQELF